MIELHLIGYTADLTHLVLDVDPDARRGGHRLVIDADLFLTLDEIRDLRREAGLDVGDLTDDASDTAAPSTHERAVAEISGEEEPVVFEPESTTETTGPIVDVPDEDEESPETRGDAVAPAKPAGELVRILHGDDLGTARPDPLTDGVSGEQDGLGDAAAGVIAGRDGSGADEVPADRGTDGGERDTPDDAAPDAGPGDRPSSLLSPAEIQTLLRGGRSPRSVAKRAETDVSWVERWLPPIVAERNQILDRAKQARLNRPRLGASSQPLGRAVETNLRGRGVELEDVDWSAKRRADGTWSVSVRYTSRGRSRTASWRFDREAGSISSSSRLATELGFTKRRTRRTKA